MTRALLHPAALARVILSVAIAAGIAFVTLSPIELRPVTGLPVDLERFGALLAVTGAFCLTFPRHRLAILLLILAAVGLLEIGQHLVPGRHGTVHDAVVKGSGAVFGALLAAAADRLSAGWHNAEPTNAVGLNPAGAGAIR